jgi:hypothetical protein
VSGGLESSRTWSGIITNEDSLFRCHRASQHFTTQGIKVSPYLARRWHCGARVVGINNLRPAYAFSPRSDKAAAIRCSMRMCPCKVETRGAESHSRG